MAWDYTYDTPFEELDYTMANYALCLIETINDKEFTKDQAVEVMMALFSPRDDDHATHDLESAVKCIANNLESIPGFDLFDASTLLARLFGRTKERTMDDLMAARHSRRETAV